MILKKSPSRSILALLACAAVAAGAEVAVTVSDSRTFHTSAPGQPAVLTVRHNYSGPGVIRAQWKQFGGGAFGNPVVIPPGRDFSLNAPFENPGYYGLVFESDNPDVSFPAARREFGFAVLPDHPVLERGLKPNSPFGLVHAAIDDPFVHPGYIKTMVVPETRVPNSWITQVQDRRRRGLIEVPLQGSDTWKGNPSAPVTAAELTARAADLQRAFAADPGTLYWELGIEENLWPGSSAPYYWPNLAAKFEAVRQAAAVTNPGVQLLYQIEGFDYNFFRAFFANAVARFVDILSLHPYRWEGGFPSPETWLESHVRTVQAMMQTPGVRRIWITEIGAPVHGNPDPNGFFGAPGSRARVKGHTRDGNAIYMVKTHLLALAAGVEKVFWYNYRDRGASIEDVEDHFGLVDYWGFPKPAYAAYANMINRLDGRKLVRRFTLPGNVLGFEFAVKGESCYVLWTWPESRQRVPLDLLRLQGSQITAVHTTVGAPMALPSGDITVDGAPVYITARQTYRYVTQ